MNKELIIMCLSFFSCDSYFRICSLGHWKDQTHGGPKCWKTEETWKTKEKENESKEGNGDRGSGCGEKEEEAKEEEGEGVSGDDGWGWGGRWWR